MQSNIEGLSNIINKFQYITELQEDKKESLINDVCNRAINISTVSDEDINKGDNFEIITRTNYSQGGLRRIKKPARGRLKSIVKY